MVACGRKCLNVLLKVSWLKLKGEIFWNRGEVKLMMIYSLSSCTWKGWEWTPWSSLWLSLSLFYLFFNIILIWTLKTVGEYNTGTWAKGTFLEKLFSVIILVSASVGVAGNFGEVWNLVLEEINSYVWILRVVDTSLVSTSPVVWVACSLCEYLGPVVIEWVKISPYDLFKDSCQGLWENSASRILSEYGQVSGVLRQRKSSVSWLLLTLPPTWYAGSSPPCRNSS